MTAEEFLQQWNNKDECVRVHTSGSTGKPKDISLRKEHMKASAQMTCRHLHLKEGDKALLCLPVDYIGGKMMVVRAETCGLTLTEIPVSSAPMQYLVEGEEMAKDRFDLVAMVPMQVINALKDPKQKELLQGIKHIIIGGGSIDKTLEEELKNFPNYVWSTYGMTETVSHIALRRLNGEEASEWYEPLEGVSVGLNAEGCLTIHAPKITSEDVSTNDLAELHADGRRFRILGRKDNVINSGGLKIQMEEVEKLLQEHLQNDFVITRLPHSLYGECVTLLTTNPDLESTESICRKHLPKHWVPKVYLHTENIPKTDNGKVARREAELLAKAIATTR